MLGIRPTHEGLLIDPVIPKKWDKFKVRRLFRGATYEISVENPKHVSNGVKRILVNGEEQRGTLIKPLKGKSPHHIRVIMG